MKSQRLVLASTSIYRRELLRRLQIAFEVANPGADESPLPGETPGATATRLSRNKARAVAARYPDAMIIGSDQVAVIDGVELGKPGNYENARRQLQLVSGKSVAFHTAVSLFNSGTGSMQTRVVSTLVKFRLLTDAQIERYLAKEQPYHCAGSAKCEGLGIALIERMEGDDPNALIGLPLIALVEMLTAEGVEIV